MSSDYTWRNWMRPVSSNQDKKISMAHAIEIFFVFRVCMMHLLNGVVYYKNRTVVQ